MVVRSAVRTLAEACGLAVVRQGLCLPATDGSAVRTLAEACGLAVARGFASVPVEEIGSENPTGRPRGSCTEYLETELNHITSHKTK